VLLHAGSDEDVSSLTPIYWADKTDTQKYGGAITYCRRYAIMALLCLNAEDDDAQHARTPRREEDSGRTYSPLAPTDNIEKADRGSIAGVPKQRPAFDEEGAKKALVRGIMIAAGKLPTKPSDESIKDAMYQKYVGNPLDRSPNWSRTDLTLDQLTEFKDIMDRKVAIELGKA
jgi:hypothetical protein